MNITILDDASIEGSERFLVYLYVPSSTSGVGVGPSGHRWIFLTIADNDCTIEILQMQTKSSYTASLSLRPVAAPSEGQSSSHIIVNC